MKNILAENLLRFGVKNLNHVDKAVVQHLSEQNPAGSTLSPEAQAKIDAMIAASNALVAPIKGLSFAGTGKAAGSSFKVSDVKISHVKDTPEVYVSIYFGKSLITIYFGASSKDKKSPVISSRPIGDQRYMSLEKPITGENVVAVGTASEGPWVSQSLAYAQNKDSWDKVAAGITSLANKYITTGIATNESKIYEQTPASGTLSAGAQESIDKLVAETQGIVSKYINSSLKLDLLYRLGGKPVSVLKATVRGRQHSNTGGISIDVDFNIKADHGTWYSLEFPIYSVDGKKPAGYYGKDIASGKTSFDTQFVKSIGQYFQTNGANYEACKQGIWNGIVAVADKYTKSGVATK